MRIFTSLMLAVALGGTALAVNPVRPVMTPLQKGTEQAISQRKAFGALKKAPMKGLSSEGAKELYITEYNTNWVHYEYSGDWYCTFMLQGEDMYDFHLDIYADNLVGHFTEADLDSYYTWGRKNNVEFAFAEADITITKGAGEDLYNIDALVKTTLDETLHIVVVPQAPSMDDIEVEGKTLVSSYYYGPDWYVSFEGFDDYRVNIDFENPVEPGVLAGSYTTENFLLEYCSLYNMQTGQENLFTEINMTIVGDDLLHDIEITGTGVLDNGVNVSFHYLKTLPLQPKENMALEVNIDSFRFMDPTASRNTTFVATSLDGERQFKVAYDGVKGTFIDFNQMHTHLTYLSTGETYELDHGKVTVSVSKDNVATIEAELVFKDSILYEFNADYALEIVGQKNVEVHNMSVTNLLGMINYLIGSNEEYTRVQASTMMDLHTGDYTDYMVFVLEGANGTVSSSLNVKSASLIEDAEGQLTLNAQFIGDDMVDYTLMMDFFVPEVTGEGEFASTSAELRDLTVDYGAFQIMGYDESGNDYFSIVLDDFYVHSNHFSSISQPNSDYCYIIRNLGKEDQEILTIYTCDLDLNVDGRDFSLTGTCQAGTVLYSINITGKFEEQPVYGEPNDDSERDLELSYTLDQITRYDIMPEYGYAVLTVENADSQQFSTLIYLTGETLEEGVYEINNSYAPGSVQAGTISGMTAYPTIYIEYDDLGNGLLPVWLFVEGTVTVSYPNGQLSIVVDANNTWGRHAYVEIKAENPDAIENIFSGENDGKFLDKNGVMIRKDGRVYDGWGKARH